MNCCVDALTSQEERILQKKGQLSPRKRINKFLADFRDDTPRIDIQRAVYFTESMRETEAYPMNVRWAKAILNVCQKLEVVITEDELIVGTCGGRGRHGILYPELRAGWFSKGLRDTQKKKAFRISTEDIETLEEKVIPYWKGRTAHDHYMARLPQETREVLYGEDEYGATGLMQVNDNVSSVLNWSGEYGKVLTKGLKGIKAEAKARMDAINGDLTNNEYDKLPFLEAVVIECDALITLAERYAAKAREMAEEESNPVRKAELNQIAENCSHVPANPARNFWEALQSQWFVQMGYKLEQAINGGIAMGRFDQYMYPFYKADKEAGLLDDERALELMECLWVKIADFVQFNATNAGNFWEGYAHFEMLTLSGQTTKGRDATNELTYLILRSKKEFPLHYPDLMVRLHSASPDRLLHETANLVKEGSGFPKFLNDEEIIPALVNNGGTLEEARDYAGSGCTEVRMLNKDTYMPVGANINMASALEMAINNGFVKYGTNYRQLMEPSIPVAEIQSYEDVMNNLRETYDFFVRHFMKRQTALEIANKETLAAPFMSMLHDLCQKSCMDIHQPNIPGSVYKDPGDVNINGFGTLSESLAAIKKLVFDDKKYTLEELKEAARNNFEGYEKIYQSVLNAPKYGRNDGYADEIAREVDEMLLTTVAKYNTPYGPKHIKFVPVTSHVGMGGKMGATLNGRKAGEALSEGISPTQGVDNQGPIATLLSIDHAKSRACANSFSRLLNVKLTPQIVMGEAGTRNLMHLLRSFVDLKLWHVQFNIIHRETLIKAQKDPQSYRNLIVRVAGYSAYFTDLSPALQSEIINRTEHEEIA